MKQIVINVSDESNLVEHAFEVAHAIDNGYLHGLVGPDADTWYVESV